MEYIDILDSRGKLTGQRKSLVDIHKDGDWHRTVHVWVMNVGGGILIQKRSSSRLAYPNTWDISAAGHVTSGEDSLQAATREVEEELGLRLKSSEFEYLFTVIQRIVLNSGTYINNEYNDVYLVHYNGELAGIKRQEEEVSEVKFIDYEKLERLTRNTGNDFVPHPEEYKKLFVQLHKRF